MFVYMEALKYLHPTNPWRMIVAEQQVTKMPYENGSTGVEIDDLQTPAVNNVYNAFPGTTSSRST